LPQTKIVTIIIYCVSILIGSVLWWCLWCETKKSAKSDTLVKLKDAVDSFFANKILLFMTLA